MAATEQPHGAPGTNPERRLSFANVARAAKFGMRALAAAGALVLPGSVEAISPSPELTPAVASPAPPETPREPREISSDSTKAAVSLDVQVSAHAREGGAHIEAAEITGNTTEEVLYSTQNAMLDLYGQLIVQGAEETITDTGNGGSSHAASWVNPETGNEVSVYVFSRTPEVTPESVGNIAFEVTPPFDRRVAVDTDFEVQGGFEAHGYVEPLDGYGLFVNGPDSLSTDASPTPDQLAAAATSTLSAR